MKQSSRAFPGLLAAFAALVAAGPATGQCDPPPYGGPGAGPGFPFGPGPGFPGIPVPGFPGSPGSPGSPGGSGSGPQSPGSLPALAAGLASEEDWRLWWDLNQDAYLQLKAHVYAGAAVTGAEDFFLGHGAREAAASPVRPGADEIRALVIPALERLVQEEDNPITLAAAALALARAGGSQDRAERARLEGVLRPLLRHPNQQVSETAVLSLGLLGHEPSVVLLGEILADSRVGREALGLGGVEENQRAYAAYGLGLIGRRTVMEDVRRFAAHRLVGVLEGREPALEDVPVACVIALGMIPLELPHALPAASLPQGGTPSTSRLATVDFLVEYLDDRRHSPLARAHVPRTLVQLAEGLPPHLFEELKARLVPQLLGLLRSGRERNEVRRGCALALGGLGDSDTDSLDAKLRHELARQATSARDKPVRQFALLALARIGGRPGNGLHPDEGQREIRKDLLRSLSRGKTYTRSWSGLALALLGRSLPVSEASELARPLRLAYLDTGSPIELGAYALALGLIGDREAAPFLQDRMGGSLDDQVRGTAAQGLGLMVSASAIPAMHALALDSFFRPELLVESSVGLALLGDRTILPKLLDELAESGAQTTQEALARAIGRIGDRRALAPLVALIEDEGRTDLHRAVAADALGAVVERELLPWRSELSRNLNYLATTPTLLRVLTAGRRAIGA